MSCAAQGKYIQYVLGTSGGWGGVGEGGWRGIYQVYLAQPVMNLPMSCQGNCHQVSVTLGAKDLQVESIPTREYLSSHHEGAELCGVPPYCVTGLSRHNHCLVRIGVHTKMTTQLCQDIKFPL